MNQSTSLTIEEIKKENAQLKSALQFSQVGVAVMDKDGMISFANKHWLSMHGFQHSEIKGQPISSLIVDLQHRGGMGLVFPEDQQTIVNTFQHVSKSGQVFRGLDTVVALKDAANLVVGYSWTSVQTPEQNFDTSLAARDQVIRAINYAAEMFLTSAHWQEYMDEILKRLGEAVGVSRAYLFLQDFMFDPSAQPGLLSQTHEWIGDGISPQIDNPDLQHLKLADAGFARWQEALKNGQVIHGPITEFPESEQPLLKEQGIQSLAVVPVMFQKQWIGFIGFDDCVDQRSWHIAELDLLKTAARFINAAIQRQKHGQEVSGVNLKLQTKNDELQRLNKLMVDREVKMVELKEELTQNQGGTKGPQTDD